MQVGIVQVCSKTGELERNLELVEENAKRAKQAGCELLLLPEMMDTGYDLSTISETAAAWDAKPLSELKRIAAENQITIVSGLSEREGDKIYNSVAVVGGDGELITSYRKVHLMSIKSIPETSVFTPGDSLTVFTIGEMTFGLIVCYDLRFPEITRALTLRGAHVILVPSAWPAVRSSHWKTLVSCRAIENQIYMVCANQVGRDRGLEYAGCSCVIDPWGNSELGFASDSEECFFTAEIKLDEVNKTREFMPVLKQRREDLY